MKTLFRKVLETMFLSYLDIWLLCIEFFPEGTVILFYVKFMQLILC